MPPKNTNTREVTHEERSALLAAVTSAAKALGADVRSSDGCLYVRAGVVELSITHANIYSVGGLAANLAMAEAVVRRAAAAAPRAS